MSMDKQLDVIVTPGTSFRKRGGTGPGKSLHDQLGASGIEYAVIVGIVVVAFVIAFSVLDLGGFFESIVGAIQGGIDEIDVPAGD